MPLSSESYARLQNAVALSRPDAPMHIARVHCSRYPHNFFSSINPSPILRDNGADICPIFNTIHRPLYLGLPRPLIDFPSTTTYTSSDYYHNSIANRTRNRMKSKILKIQVHGPPYISNQAPPNSDGRRSRCPVPR